MLPLRGLRRLSTKVDVLGSALAVVALGSLVWAFAAADPATEFVAHGAWLLPVALVWGGLRRARAPDADPVLPLRALRPVGAWGALLVNLLVGAAWARAGRRPVRPGGRRRSVARCRRAIDIAMPVGAVAGGWLCRWVAPRIVAAGGMALAAMAFVAMTSWDARSLDGVAATAVLLAAGLGFGLAIAPVNAVLLAVTGTDVHGSASALAVVARTVGMLVGLSLLTAVALRRFTAEVAAISSLLESCPRTPADCPAYDAATEAAVLTQLHTVSSPAPRSRRGSRPSPR